MKEMLGKRDQWKPEEKVFKYRQSIHHKDFLSEYVFPSVSHYPKNFNTRDTRVEAVLNESQSKGGAVKQDNQALSLYQRLNPKPQFLEPKQYVCPVTGQRARYRDPLTGTPYATKEAFKIIREKFFQKDEDKLQIRLQAFNDLLAKKKKVLHKMMEE